jgi:hypothetical protein
VRGGGCCTRFGVSRRKTSADLGLLGPTRLKNLLARRGRKNRKEEIENGLG